jgi:MFS family permease
MSERPSGCRVGESSKDSNDNFPCPSSLTLVILETFYAGFTALAQVIGIGLSIWLVDRMGRRKLVLLSLSAVTCSLIGLYVHHTAFRLSH